MPEGSFSPSPFPGHAQAQLIALIGAPRSGTTWLQSLVGSHPAIVTPQETTLFTRYIAPIDENWRWEQRGTGEDRARRRYVGLGAVLTEAEMTEAVAEFVQFTLRHVLELKPGAHMVLEKTPSHSLHVDLIARYVPGVRFIHLIRDGRDVASSLVAASQGWGASWGAPGNVARAARTWSDHVTAALRAKELGPYCELRYEDLRGEDGSTRLREVFDFCGLDVSERSAAERLRQFSFGEQRAGARAIVVGGDAARFDDAEVEPEGFFNRGEVGTWDPSWTTRERVEFDAEAGELLRELGYVPDDAWLGPAREVRVARRRRRDVTH